MFDIQHCSNRKHVRDRKQKTTQINNQKENVKRLPQMHTLGGDLVSMKTDQKTERGSDACQGPFPSVRVNDDGTVQGREGLAMDAHDMRMVTPFGK
jgi:hypothetical protein